MTLLTQRCKISLLMQRDAAGGNEHVYTSDELSDNDYFWKFKNIESGTPGFKISLLIPKWLDDGIIEPQEGLQAATPNAMYLHFRDEKQPAASTYSYCMRVIHVVDRRGLSRRFTYYEYLSFILIIFGVNLYGNLSCYYEIQPFKVYLMCNDYEEASDLLRLGVVEKARLIYQSGLKSPNLKGDSATNLILSPIHETLENIKCDSTAKFINQLSNYLRKHFSRYQDHWAVSELSMVYFRKLILLMSEILAPVRKMSLRDLCLAHITLHINPDKLSQLQTVLPQDAYHVLEEKLVFLHGSVSSSSRQNADYSSPGT